MTSQNDVAHWKFNIPLMIIVSSASHHNCVFLLHLEIHNTQRHFYTEWIKPTINKSTPLTTMTVCQLSAIISKVYLLTNCLLKAETSRRPRFYAAATDVTVRQQRLSPLNPLFIWKSLVLFSLGPLLMKNQISD